MNELVKHLSERNPIMVGRPVRNIRDLRHSIDSAYVHVRFKNTGTEIGVRLDQRKCRLENGDFVSGKGKVHLEGALMLDFDTVRCVADIDLESMEGTGRLEPIDQAEFTAIVHN